MPSAAASQVGEVAGLRRNHLARELLRGHAVGDGLARGVGLEKEEAVEAAEAGAKVGLEAAEGPSSR